MKATRWRMAIAGLACWLAACAGTTAGPSGPTSTPGGGLDEPYPPAVPAAMVALAEELGRSPQEIAVVRFDSVDWPDSCLGLPSQDEQCAQVVTPGWRVVLRLDAAEYELHTDEFGTQVRRR